MGVLAVQLREVADTFVKRAEAPEQVCTIVYLEFICILTACHSRLVYSLATTPQRTIPATLFDYGLFKLVCSAVILNFVLPLMLHDQLLSLDSPKSSPFF